MIQMDDVSNFVGNPMILRRGLEYVHQSRVMAIH